METCQLGQEHCSSSRISFHFRSLSTESLKKWQVQISDTLKMAAQGLKVSIPGEKNGVSDKTWSTGERNCKPLWYSCLENPINSMKRQKDMTLKDELPRWVGAQNATGEEWRNNSRKNEEMEPKQKQHQVVDVTGDGSKV